MTDNNVVYMVGWCPDCGRTVVVRHEEEWTCGCGHDLLNLTSCFSPAQVADAAHVLRGDIEELAIAGFSAAVKEGSVHLNAVPVSDDEDAPGIVMLEKVVRE